MKTLKIYTLGGSSHITPAVRTALGLPSHIVQAPIFVADWTKADAAVTLRHRRINISVTDREFRVVDNPKTQIKALREAGLFAGAAVVYAIGPSKVARIDPGGQPVIVGALNLINGHWIFDRAADRMPPDETDGAGAEQREDAAASLDSLRSNPQALLAAAAADEIIIEQLEQQMRRLRYRRARMARMAIDLRMVPEFAKRTGVTRAYVYRIAGQEVPADEADKIEQERLAKADRVAASVVGGHLRRLGQQWPGPEGAAQ